MPVSYNKSNIISTSSVQHGSLFSAQGGQVGECCGCTSVPSMCGGNTQCELTFPANHAERCVWVKIDNDDNPSENKEVTLSISGGQNSDKTNILVHDDSDG